MLQSLLHFDNLFSPESLTGGSQVIQVLLMQETALLSLVLYTIKRTNDWSRIGLSLKQRLLETLSL